MSYNFAGTAKITNEINKLSLLEHKNSPYKDQDWVAVSESTIRSVLKKQGLNVHKADVETFARFASTTDYRTYLTLFSAFKAMRRLYGYTEHEGDHEEEPRLNPSNVFNLIQVQGRRLTSTNTCLTSKVHHSVRCAAREVYVNNIP